MAQEGAVSVVRQNYAAESEAAVNKQINIELYASYVYLSMVSTSSLIYIQHHYACYTAYFQARHTFFFIKVYRKEKFHKSV